MNGTLQFASKMILQSAMAAGRAMVVSGTSMGPPSAPEAQNHAQQNFSTPTTTLPSTHQQLAFFRSVFSPASEASEAGEEVKTVPQDIVFGIAIIVAGGAFLYHNLSRLKLPYTVIMFFYGLAMGLLGTWLEGGAAAATATTANPFADIFTGLGYVSPELVFHIFLPILIFEGSYGMKTHAFWVVIPLVLLLAGPGLLINISFIAVVLKVMYPVWSWFMAGLLGALLSATDPVAVVALLKDLGVDKRMTALVDGEAIMNDGTAIIVFSLLLPASQVGEITDPFYVIFSKCLQLTVGAAAFGWCVGIVTKHILRKAHGNDLVQTCITVSFAYMAFFIADAWLKTSGVLTLCFMGVYLATYMPTLFPGKEGSSLNHTWHFLVHIANTALFALVGIVIARDVAPFLEIGHIFKVLALYVAATLARFTMIMMLRPVFAVSCKGYSIGLREAVMLVHGGLRGGVSTMLGLIIFHTHDGLSLEDRAEMLILTAGIVLLTLAVNATTAQAVVSLLGHRAKDENRLKQMEVGLTAIREIAVKAIQETRHHPFFTGADWDVVTKLVRDSLEKSPYDGIPAIRETEERIFNILVMRAFKTSVWQMRDGGNISEEAVRILCEASSKCIAKGQRISLVRDVLPLMTYPSLLATLYRWCFPKADRLTSANAAVLLAANGSIAGGNVANTIAAATSTSPPAPSTSFFFMSQYVLDWRLSVDMDFFAILVAYSEGLEQLENIYPHYVPHTATAADDDDDEASRKRHPLAIACANWLQDEMDAIEKRVKAYGKRRPRTLCAFMTRNAGTLIAKDLYEGAERLHETLGFAAPAVEAFVHVCAHMRDEIANKWPREMGDSNTIAAIAAATTQTVEQKYRHLFAKSPLLAGLLPASATSQIREVELSRGESFHPSYHHNPHPLHQNNGGGGGGAMEECAYIVVNGVLSVSGTSHLTSVGPGDVFNVAPAIAECRSQRLLAPTAAASSYTVTSKDAAILAIPYSLLRTACGSYYQSVSESTVSAASASSSPSSSMSAELYFKLLVALASEEVLAPIAKREVAELAADGKVTVEGIASRFAGAASGLVSDMDELFPTGSTTTSTSKSAQIIIASYDDYAFSSELLQASSFSPNSWHTHSDNDAQNKHNASALAHHVFFLRGSATLVVARNSSKRGDEDSSTSAFPSFYSTAMGPSLIPASLVSSLRWAKGSVLVALPATSPTCKKLLGVSVSDLVAGGGGDEANRVDAVKLHALIKAMVAAAAASSPASSSPHHTRAKQQQRDLSIIVSSTAGVTVGPTTVAGTNSAALQPDTSLVVGVGALTRAGDEDAVAESTTAMPPALEDVMTSSPSVYFDTELMEQFSPSPTLVVGKKSPFIVDPLYRGDLAMTLMNTVLTEYIQAVSLLTATTNTAAGASSSRGQFSRVPYLRSLQLQFLHALERFVHHVVAMQAHNSTPATDAGSGEGLQAATADVVNFLQSFAVQYFAAERRVALLESPSKVANRDDLDLQRRVASQAIFTEKVCEWQCNLCCSIPTHASAAALAADVLRAMATFLFTSVMPPSSTTDSRSGEDVFNFTDILKQSVSQ